MNLSTILWSVPIAHVTLTRTEIELLLGCSQHHYDGHCRDVGRQGGFLYGWANRLNYFNPVPNAPSVLIDDATFRQLDTCAKLLEMPLHIAETEAEQTVRHTLRGQIARALAEINAFVRAERERLLPQSP